MGTLKHYTKRRYAQVIATLSKLNEQYWQTELHYNQYSKETGHYQKRRKDLMKVLEMHLSDMTFYGLIDAGVDDYLVDVA